MSQDLMHGAEVKELVRDAYRHVPPTTAAVVSICARWYNPPHPAISSTGAAAISSRV
jgi:hypothetical protein